MIDVYPSILMFNARSITGKFDDLCVTVGHFKPDMIMVTETWLGKDFSSDLLTIPHYELFRSDRVNRRGGGVCIWVHERFRPSRSAILDKLLYLY